MYLLNHQANDDSLYKYRSLLAALTLSFYKSNIELFIGMDCSSLLAALSLRITCPLQK